jgi:CRISPR-associated endonuclease Csn1
MEIEDFSHLTFNLKFTDLVNRQTGEVVENGLLDSSFEHEPLYKLWHVLYSIDDPVHLIKVLQSKFGFTADQAAILNKIDFKKQGFGSKSARAIRKLLPQLMKGSDYTQAAQIAGYNHSNSITKEENEQRPLVDQVELYKRNALRQPVVEKVLNQLVNLVNAIVNEASLGRPDEIRIELARELRQSKDERERTTKMNNARNKEYEDIYTRLSSEYPGLTITSKVMEKYRLYHSQDGTCLYTGKRMELAMVLRGEGVDIDHIIPQSKLFDDSFQNKVLVFRQANLDKSNKTAMDYISSISAEAEHQYKERVDKLYEDKSISNAKRNRLLMKESEIPSDFISRQLNETRFISKEATKLLTSICRKVTSTSGSVTEFLRNQWGYNEVLQQLNYTKYEQAGLTTNGKIDKDKWSKRDDHRHHAIDALVVAATSQGMIQQLNTLNSSRTREEMLAAIEGKTTLGWQQKKSLVEQYAQTRQPFHTEEVKQATAEIIISMKAGKKVAVPSKKKGQAVLVPRGQLHNETVYGKIKRYATEKTPLNGRFKLEYLEKIVSEKERQLITERLAAFDNDPKKAFKNLEATPIFLDEAKTKILTAVTLWEEHFVVKYKLNETFKEKDVQYIVDHGIRELVRQRLEQHGNDSKKAFQNLEKDPIWKNKSKGERVTSVRCFTGMSGLVPLHKAVSGQTLPQSANIPGTNPVDFVSPSNNHHLAIYQLPDGSYLDIAVSLWEAVNRKKAGLPVVVDKPKEAWDKVLETGLDDQQLFNNLPPQDAVFILSMAQNDFFVFNQSRDDSMSDGKKTTLNQLSKKIYRVQKVSNAGGAINIFFRHHLETRVDDKKTGSEMLSKKIGKLVIISSISSLLQQNPVKIKLNVLGEMQLV